MIYYLASNYIDRVLCIKIVIAIMGCMIRLHTYALNFSNPIEPVLSLTFTTFFATTY